MAQHAARPGETTGLTRWVGWILFVGLVMIISGLLSLIQGLVALFDDDFYLVTASGLPLPVDYSYWGWILVGFGAMLIGGGYALMFGHTWARLVALVVTGLHAFINLTFLAAYPIWSVLAITLDLIAIYAIAVHGAEGKLLRHRQE
ncbi:hypothetical protein BJ973_002241 [Actinoplanes tereljensis]|uniref:Membrane protein n=1 Tax=Paractinoplanes tereljensis TaxID=571912 RepID=A0A919NPZ1_9ACTN|nr:hypothetical protein [Actinoplanes tereljensis]GIF21914.1 membrane protein [Actinoplanes tereljensis]